MRKRKSINHKIKTSFAVVVDGETEAFYLQMLKRNERKIRINIKPEIPHRKNLSDQYNLVCDLANKEFTKVFWIVDFDTIIKESKETPKGEKSKIQLFNEYKAKLTKDYPHVVVIVNNPCLEYWFLLHFKQTSKYFNTCSSVERSLNKHLPTYDKTRKYFTKQNEDIYLKLRPYLKTAIENSILLGNFDSRNPQKAMCEMELLFQTKELKNFFE